MSDKKEYSINDMYRMYYIAYNSAYTFRALGQIPLSDEDIDLECRSYLNLEKEVV